MKEINSHLQVDVGHYEGGKFRGLCIIKFTRRKDFTHWKTPGYYIWKGIEFRGTRNELITACQALIRMLEDIRFIECQEVGIKADHKRKEDEKRFKDWLEAQKSEVK